MRFFSIIVALSFPVALAAFFFWPSFTNESTSPTLSVAEDDLLNTPQIIKDYDPAPIKSDEILSGPKHSTAQVKPKIYKWVDESGRVVFSDKAGHEDAVAHTPPELAQLSVSDDVKQRIARDSEQVRREKIQAIRKYSVVSKQTTTYSAKSMATNYKFSNTSAGQKHKYVLLSGRVSGGSACDQLRVVVRAKSDHGRSVSGEDIVSYNGTGSTLFELRLSSSWNGGSRRPQWEITKLYASCISR